MKLKDQQWLLNILAPHVATATETRFNQRFWFQLRSRLRSDRLKSEKSVEEIIEIFLNASSKYRVRMLLNKLFFIAKF